MSKWKARYEQEHRAYLVASDTIDVSAAEHIGLVQAYRTILQENRSLYDEWRAERRRMRKLERKVARMKKRGWR